MANIKQNYLSPIEFRFVIQRLPHVTFFTQNLSLPGVSLNPIEQPTPFKKLYHTGDSLTYDRLSVSFRVDENMKNYIELYNWMVGMTFPDNFEQFANLDESQDGLYSDASVLIMSNSKNPNVTYKFKNIFPESITNIDMDTTQGDIDYVIATCSFVVESYTITAGKSS